MQIDIQNVSKYINEKPILLNINWQIAKGSLVAIKGKSGSGKTTLLNVISLLDKTSAGTILLNGNDVTNISLRSRRNLFRKDIGFVFQNYGLLENSSVKDNLLMGLKFQKLSKKEKTSKMVEVLDQVNLSVSLNEKVSSLSGGEQQRVGLARCILKDSSLIVADEPTASLDSENEKIMMLRFRELRDRGYTIVLTTHSEQYDDWFDDILYL